MLAMEVNDDAGSLTPRGALRFFASMLAPTRFHLVEPHSIVLTRDSRLSGDERDLPLMCREITANKKNGNTPGPRKSS